MMTRGSILNLLILLIFCSNVSMAKRVFTREPSLNIPKEELIKHIELRKVKNNWMPKGLGEAEGGVLPRFEGSPDDALKIFERKGDKYTFDKQPLASADQLMTDSFGYRKDKESIFILHTIGTDAQHLSVRNVVSALAMRRLIWNEYNLFLFNMPNVMDFMLKHVVRSIFIPAGTTKLQEVGTVLGNFFNSLIVKELINANQIHIVGFCFSSQISGYIGRYVSSYNGGERIKSITALDPFTLGLSGVFNKPISKDDAQLVHIYHTNSIALGTLYRRGTADFIFNNGWIQPGCYFSENYNCSHWKVCKYFWNVILYPELWVARSCPSWLRFKTCLCNARASVSITFPPVEGARGSYYLNTLAHKPYGIGPQAAYCYTRKIDKDTL